MQGRLDWTSLCRLDWVGQAVVVGWAEKVDVFRCVARGRHVRGKAGEGMWVFDRLCMRDPGM